VTTLPGSWRGIFTNVVGASRAYTANFSNGGKLLKLTSYSPRGLAPCEYLLAKPGSVLRYVQLTCLGKNPLSGGRNEIGISRAGASGLLTLNIYNLGNFGTDTSGQFQRTAEATSATIPAVFRGGWSESDESDRFVVKIRSGPVSDLSDGRSCHWRLIRWAASPAFTVFTAKGPCKLWGMNPNGSVSIVIQPRKGLSAATNRLQFDLVAPDKSVSLALRSGLKN
jgi:hypothetical protein